MQVAFSSRRATNAPAPGAVGIVPLPQSNLAMQLTGRDLSGKGFFELGYRKNALVHAGVNLRGVTLQMARLIAKDENGEDVEECNLLTLLKRPNPWQTWSAFILQLEALLLLGGQTFVYKVRDGSGVIAEVYLYNSSQITPVAGTYEVINHYRYDNGAGGVRTLDPWNVGRLTYGMNDWDRPWKHTGPMSPLATLIDTDNEAINLGLSLVTRGAIPASLITLPPRLTASGEPDNYSQAELVEYKQLFETSYSGANRGSNMIGPPGTDVKILGFDPKRMATESFSTIPETRFLDVFGIPAQMTSLWSARMMKTYANYSEARLSFYQDTMIPHSIHIAEQLTMMFAEEIFRDRKQVTLSFDWSRAQVLQDYTAKRIQELYEGNGAKLEEVLKANGLPEDTEYGGKYLFELLAGPGQPEAGDEGEGEPVDSEE